MAGDGTCDKCRPGWPSNCLNGSSFGNHGVDGGQGEAVRVPYADQTLVAVPGTGHDDDTLATLVALSDVMCTGHHTAVSASVKHGDTVAAVGDGAVRLCAVIAAKHLGTDRIISLSRNPTRQALAAELGATDIVSERGKGATIRINNMTNRIGVGAALECIGTGQSMATAFQHRPRRLCRWSHRRPSRRRRPDRHRHLPQHRPARRRRPCPPLHPRPAPRCARRHLNPGRVFDYATNLDGVVDAYQATDECRAIKSRLRIGPST